MKNKLKYPTLAAVVLFDVYYGIDFILCLFGYDKLGMGAFVLALMAVVTLPSVFESKIEAKLGKLFLPLRIGFTALLSVYLATVAIFWLYIGLDGAKTADTYASAVEAARLSPDNSSDLETILGSDTVVVVFGCRTNGYTPGDNLALRLDETYKLLTALPNSICVVTGGQGSNETVPEADAMKLYLLNLGIAESRILVERDSHSTSENIRFTKKLLESSNVSRKRIIAVSTAFHLPRIESLAERYWHPVEVCAAPSPNFARYYTSLFREYFSYIKMIFFDTAVIDF